MAGRRHHDEIAFGSDSFLDIVANIVGILIILIVIAGLRVSQMPAVGTTEAKSPPRDTSTPLLSIPSPEPATTEAPEFTTPPAPQDTAAPPEPIKPPRELLARIDRVTSEIAGLKAEQRSLSAMLVSTMSDAKVRRQHRDAMQAVITQEQTSAENGRRTIVALQTELDMGLREIAGLHLELAEAEASAPQPQELRHKLTPVGRLVEGPELHFLLSEGRVAVVPIEELGEELHEELQRKRNQLLRGQRRVGSVGPVKGFKMEYMVEREAISLMDELRMGTAVIKLGISEWRILPQHSAVYETADEALLTHSRFLGALRTAGANATLTFWVYPDSFALNQELQQFAHDNSFDVAARPLPYGIPITGSRQGTRSVAQ